MPAPFRLACLFAMVLLPAARLLADVTIVETVTNRMGGQSAQAIRTTYIKGSRMRVEPRHGRARRRAGATISKAARVDPIADAVFAIPDGWKRDVKK